jgi:hypothetical protein
VPLGAGNSVLRFDQIASVGLEHIHDVYRVHVHHSHGLPDFMWATNTLDDAQHLEDAIAALAHH